MKVLIRVLAMYFACLSTRELAAQSYFRQGDFTETQAIAQREQKPIFVFFTAAWCGPCLQMKRSVFDQDSIRAYLQQHFILHVANIGSVEGGRLSAQYEITSLPGMALLSPEGGLLYGFGGYRKSSDFMQQIQYAQNPKNQVFTLYKAYMRDTNDLVAGRDYILALANSGQSARADRVFKQWLRRPVEELAHPDHFALWERLAYVPYHNAYPLVLEHRALFREKIGADRVETFLKESMNGWLSVVAQYADTSGQRFWLDYSKLYFSAEDHAEFALSVAAWRTVSDPCKDLKTWDKYLRTYPNTTSQSANIAAWAVCQNPCSKSALKLALEWSKNAVAFAPTPLMKVNCLDTQAHLLYKLKRYAAAQKIIDEVVAECQRSELSPPSTTPDLQTELAKKLK